MRNYAVTGIGLHNRLGSEPYQSWNNLIDGISAIHNINVNENYRFKDFSDSLANVKLASLIDGDIDYYETCMAVVDQIIETSGIEENTGSILSTIPLSFEDQTFALREILNGKKKVSIKKLLAGDSNYLGYLIAKKYGNIGPSINTDQLCVTSIISIQSAIAHMEMDNDIPGFLVLNCNFINALTTYCLSMFRALSQSDTYKGIKPFDINRNGIAIADCIAGIMIEPLESALDKGKKVLAIIKGINSNMVADSPTSPDPEGKGITKSMNAALNMAGLNKPDIEYVNAHATGTPTGDIIELKAIIDLFPNAQIVSNKGQIGHGIISGGMAEIVYSIISMYNGVFAGNYNLENPCIDNANLPYDKFELKPKYMIKNSLAFGGRNSSIILGAT